MAYPLVSAGAVSFPLSGMAFGQPTTAGNLLVACVYNTATVSTPSGWTLAVSKVGADGDWAGMFHKPNCGAGETNPFTGTGGGFLAEYAGALTTSPLDKTGSATSSGTSATATASGADTASGELLIGFSVWERDSGTAAPSNAFNHGTAVTAAIGTVSQFYIGPGIGSYCITTSNSGANTCLGSQTGATVFECIVLLASFKGTFTPPPATNKGFFF